ncbi:MAG TPA: ammonium transporter [Candidatus Sulfotelmatobacter sp.]|nr:ammonium transporter [Candidatus Sulfotelmatobacter sp.]
MKKISSKPEGSRLRSSLTLRLKITACATLLLAVVTTVFVWKTATAAPQQSAPPAAPAVQATPSEPALPSYFSGLKAPDSTGSNYGVWSTPSGTPNADGSLGGDVPSKLGIGDLYDRILHNQYSINIIWTLLSGALVYFMQLGFAFLEAGFARAKNANHTTAMLLMVFVIGTAAYWVYGFALGWGNWFNGPAAPGWYPSLGPGLSALAHGIGLGSHGDGTFKYGLLGTGGFFLTKGFHDVGVLALFFFMSVFMETGITIPTGAMLERWNWGNFCLYSAFAPFIYCVFAGWVWGGGWLAQGGVNWHLGNGACDFAGSGVVHCVGGVMALAGAIVMGPRIGKYINGKAVSIPGHNIPWVVAGSLILGFGWLGFNPGSTLAGTDLRITFIYVNTVVASCIASIVSMIVFKLKAGTWDTGMMCNGFLAGLVAITAPCAFVTPIGASIIGIVAGVLVVYSTFFIEKMGVDDVAGAISVHGTAGAWGVLSVGLFACGEYGAGYNGVATPVIGLLYGGGFGQLLMQTIDLAVLVTWAFVVMYAWMKFSNLIIPIRPTTEEEVKGLDATQMGVRAYPDFQPAPEVPAPQFAD